MLVAVADLAALVAATGPLTMFLILAGLFVLVGGVVAARPLIRRFADAREVVARRRA
jgi:hypothetical protein